MAPDSTPALRLKAVRRTPAVTVAPAAPTPRELKLLSDIDDQHTVRYQTPTIHFYRRSAAMGAGRRDPARVIREAVARALVRYYPLAGRLRVLRGGKLAVDCTGEGVLFTEADADVRLEDLGDDLHPPYPSLYETLLFDVPGSSCNLLDSPLLRFQVTRLQCGGFIMTVRLNHTMADACGLVQFLGAVAELARGAPTLTVRPVWKRELLMARDPPRPCFAHREYDDVPDIRNATMALSGLVLRSFFFGSREIAAVRSQLTPSLQQRTSRFDILAGYLWRCRTVALAPSAGEEMRMMFTVDARRPAGIPAGYYGNAIAFPVAISTAGELCARPVGYAVELVREAKAQVDAEYLRSVADLMALRGRPRIAVMPLPGGYMVTDVTRAGFGDLDFGWGKPAYGGPFMGSYPVFSFLMPCKNAMGEDGILVPMCLPGSAMDKFAEEMGKLLSPAVIDVVATSSQQPGVASQMKSAL